MPHFPLARWCHSGWAVTLCLGCFRWPDSIFGASRIPVTPHVRRWTAAAIGHCHFAPECPILTTLTTTPCVTRCGLPDPVSRNVFRDVKHAKRENRTTTLGLMKRGHWFDVSWLTHCTTRLKYKVFIMKILSPSLMEDSKSLRRCPSTPTPSLVIVYCCHLAGNVSYMLTVFLKDLC